MSVLVQLYSICLDLLVVNMIQSHMTAHQNQNQNKQGTHYFWGAHSVFESLLKNLSQTTCAVSPRIGVWLCFLCFLLLLKYWVYFELPTTSRQTSESSKYLFYCNSLLLYSNFNVFSFFIFQSYFTSCQSFSWMECHPYRNCRRWYESYISGVLVFHLMTIIGHGITVCHVLPCLKVVPLIYSVFLLSHTWSHWHIQWYWMKLLYLRLD